MRKLLKFPFIACGMSSTTSDLLTATLNFSLKDFFISYLFPV